MATDPQKKWLEALTGKKGTGGKDEPGVVAQRDAVVKKEVKKQEMLEEMRAQYEIMKEQISEGQKFDIKKSMFSRGVSSKTEDSDANKEIDTWHDLPGMKALPEDKLREVMASYWKVEQVQKRMRDAKGEDGQPLFSTVELTEEVWTPLVREGVIPENVVPDDYSKTKQTFDGAAELYNKRLEEFSAKKQSTDELKEKLGLCKETVETCGKLASTISEIAGAPDLAGTIIDTIQVTLTAGISIATGVIEQSGDTIVENVGNIIGTAVSLWNKDIGGYVTAGFKAAAKGTAIGAAIANGKPDKAIDAIGGAISVALGVCDTPETKGQFGKIGGLVAAAFTTAAKTEIVVEELRKPKPDPNVIIKAFTDAATAATNSIVTFTTETPEDKKEAKKVKKELKEKKESIKEDIGDLKEGGSAAVELKEALEKLKEMKGAGLGEEQKKAIQKKIDAKDAEATAGQIEESVREYKEMLAAGFGMDLDPDDKEAQLAQQQLYSIEKLTTQIEADRAVLEMADKLFSGAVSLAAEAFAPLKVAVAGKDFIKNVIAAAERSIELNKWLDQILDAKKSVSIYAEPLQNRAKNLKVQISQATAQAILKLAETIGAAAACTGVGAHAGLALEKVASATSKATDQLYKVYQEVELSRQWSIYLDARKNPKDRKNVRASLRGNPTLAKYALAYGGLIAGDPIAVRALSDCGLNEKTLAQKETNAMNCVLYLEAKFADDPKLLKALPRSQTWHPPGGITLTLTCWVGIKSSAIEKADLKSEDTPALDGAFATLVKAEKTLEAAVQTNTAVDTAREGCRNSLAHLRDTLGGYKPKIKNGREDHAAMKEYKEDVLGLIDARFEELKV